VGTAGGFARALAGASTLYGKRWAAPNAGHEKLGPVTVTGVPIH